MGICRRCRSTALWIQNTYWPTKNVTDKMYRCVSCYQIYSVRVPGDARCEADKALAARNNQLYTHRREAQWWLSG